MIVQMLFDLYLQWYCRSIMTITESFNPSLVFLGQDGHQPNTNMLYSPDNTPVPNDNIKCLMLVGLFKPILPTKSSVPPRFCGILLFLVSLSPVLETHIILIYKNTFHVELTGE